MSVYKKLHQVQAATRSLAANAKGQTGSAYYGYVAGSKLLGVIRPLMDSLGLILTQEVIDIKNQPITYATRNGEKTEMFTTAHIRFTWVDTEDSSTLVNDFFANGMNAWDKGLGSALTYAERYYLMKTFHIATDEDDVDALVKEEAINSPAPKKYIPVGEETYWKIIAAYAQGKKTKSGGDYMKTWMQMTNAGEKEVMEFNHDVENWLIANVPSKDRRLPADHQDI